MSTSTQDVRTRLAHALGYHDFPANATAEPYLTYIRKRHVGSGPLDEWLELFIEVVEHFAIDIDAKGSGDGDSIRALIEDLAAKSSHGVFADTNVGQAARIDHVEDNVMYILGTWTTMLSSFVQQRKRSRKVVTAYKLCSGSVITVPDPYDNNLAGLLAGCELLPGGRWDRGHEHRHDTATELRLMMLSSSPNASVSPMHVPMQSVCSQGLGSGAD